MKSTKEQIKWFWEQCGCKVVSFPHFLEGKPSLIDVVFPDGEEQRFHEDDFAESIDLNSLFEYATPEGCQQIIFQPDGYCGITVNDKLFEAGGDTPADALYGAIYKAFGGKE